MEYRILGKTGLKVSAIGIGTWQLSGPVTIDGKPDGFPDPGRDKVIDLIQACGDLGINLIDTAEIYGDGEGQRRIGEAIQGKRDQWLLSSKFGLRRGQNGERIQNPQPDTIRVSLENSLKRLQTDYIDIYLYHSPPDPALIAQGREVLETLKQEGKIRFYGISTDDPQVLSQLIQQNSVDVVMFSRSLVTYPSELLNLVQKYNLGVMIKGALDAGRLSGEFFHQDPQFSDQDIRKYIFYYGLKPQKYAVYQQFLNESMSMPAFALRYLLDFDTTHTIILGGRSIERYQESLKVFNLAPLDSKTHQALEQIRQKIFTKSLPEKIRDRIKTIFKLW